jgi:hypothetical protein
MDFVGENLSIFVAVLGTSVDDVQARMIAAKGWIDYGLDISLNVEEAQRSIGRVEAVDVERILGFGTSWSMGCGIGRTRYVVSVKEQANNQSEEAKLPTSLTELVKVRVRGDKEELVIFVCIVFNRFTGNGRDFTVCVYHSDLLRSGWRHVVL